MKLIKTLLIGVVVLLTGCEQGLTEREKECLALTQDAEHCIRGANRHYQPIQYAPVQHTNYYGSPEHGYWDQGMYHFNDPLGEFATSTNSFLLGAGLGGLAAYKLTKNAKRSSWNKRNPSGWVSKTSYTDKKGKIISKAEFDRRKAQSLKDKIKNKQTVTKQKMGNSVNLNKKVTTGNKPVPNSKSLVTKKPVVNKPVYNKSTVKNPSHYKKPVYNKPVYNKPKMKPIKKSYSSSYSSKKKKKR